MIEATYQGRNRTIRTEPHYMYDKGIKLLILNPPAGEYRIDLEDGTILTPIDDVVTLPDSLFLQAGDVPLYIGVRDGESFNTIAKIIVPVSFRPPRPE